MGALQAAGGPVKRKSCLCVWLGLRCHCFSCFCWRLFRGNQVCQVGGLNGAAWHIRLIVHGPTRTLCGRGNPSCAFGCSALRIRAHGPVGDALAAAGQAAALCAFGRTAPLCACFWCRSGRSGASASRRARARWLRMRMKRRWVGGQQSLKLGEAGWLKRGRWDGWRRASRAPVASQASLTASRC